MDDAAAEIQSARARREQALAGRERLVEGVSALAMIAAALAILATRPWPHTDPVIAIGLIVMLAVLANVEFEISTGAAVPTQLAFVPMLFLLPPTLVPAAVVCGYIAAAAMRRRRLGRGLLLAISSCWFSVGPAVLLAIAGPPDSGGDLVLLAVFALIAQIGCDLANWHVHELALGRTHGPELRSVAWVYAFDVVLTPVGLLVVLATPEARLAFLLPIAVVALLELHRRERAGRLDSLEDLSHAYRGTALLLGEMIEGDDPYTRVHSTGVVDLAAALARALDYGGPTAMRDVEFAALLHDIGKIKIPKEILRKPAALDDREWQIMRLHPVLGADMLTSAGGVLAGIAVAVRHHHERWDGTGYPDGLSGAEIPLLSRILAVCDTYSAITTDRPYRPARDPNIAFAELHAGSGSQFDPAVVAAFAELFEAAGDAAA
jgi:putative nucleotidyltransferase with HDIG domain